MAFPHKAAGRHQDRTGRSLPRKDTFPDTEAVSQEVFMGCTIYAASPKALPADEAAGQDTYCRHLHGNCSQRIAAR